MAMERLSSQDSQSNFEMSLRDQLIAAQGVPPTETHSDAASSDPSTYPDPSNVNTHDGHIDPSIGGASSSRLGLSLPRGLDMSAALQAMAREAESGQPAGSKRELQTSKRAAQNRAAQRAFRQRKEAYIEKLEKQLKDYRVMGNDYKTLQQENYQLREYILSLQSRLLESSSEIPPPPPQVTLQNPEPLARPTGTMGQERPTEQHPSLVPSRAPVASMSAQSNPIAPTAVEQLQAAAARAGELGTSVERPTG